jgi:hypothetical protein
MFHKTTVEFKLCNSEDRLERLWYFHLKPQMVATDIDIGYTSFAFLPS